MVPHMPSAVLAISGASGARYGVRLLEQLCAAGWEVHLIVTSAGAINLDLECGITPEELAATNGASLFSEVMKGMWILPGAILGAMIGARLTSILPLRTIRIVFALLVAVAATRMFWSAASLLP